MKVKMFIRLKPEEDDNDIDAEIVTKEMDFDDEVMDSDILKAVDDFLCDELTWGYDVIEDRKHIILPIEEPEKKAEPTERGIS